MYRGCYSSGELYCSGIVVDLTAGNESGRLNHKGELIMVSFLISVWVTFVIAFIGITISEYYLQKSTEKWLVNQVKKNGLVTSDLNESIKKLQALNIRLDEELKRGVS